MKAPFDRGDCNWEKLLHIGGNKAYWLEKRGWLGIWMTGRRKIIKEQSALCSFLLPDWARILSVVMRRLRQELPSLSCSFFSPQICITLVLKLFSSKCNRLRIFFFAKYLQLCYQVSLNDWSIKLNLWVILGECRAVEKICLRKVFC